MAHEITSNDRFGYVGQPAWHGIGVELDGSLTAVEGLKSVQLHKPVETCEIFGQRLTLDGFVNFPIPSHRVQIRPHLLDQGEDAGIYGVVSKDYVSFQDLDLAQMADEIRVTDHRLRLETVGSLQHGKRIFILMKANAYEVVKGDTVYTYLCLSQGHGGVEAVRLDPTMIRVVCANTYKAMVSSSTAGSTIRHMGNMEANLASAKAAVQEAMLGIDKAKERDRALVGVQLRPQPMSDYFQSVYRGVFGEVDERKPESVEKFQKTITEWIERLEGENQRLAGITGTAWAAVNAITEWSDHYRGRGSARRRNLTESRVASNLFGASNQTKSVAYAKALELV